MKDALLVSLDAWQKYWGNGFYEYLLLIAVVYFLIFGRKKERVKLFLIYVIVFLGIFFLDYTKMCRRTGILESIVAGSGGTSDWICRNLPDPKSREKASCTVGFASSCDSITGALWKRAGQRRILSEGP